MTQTAYTARGARALDKATADAAAADAAVKQATAAQAQLQVDRERALLEQEMRRGNTETRAVEDAAKAKAKARKHAARAARRADLRAAVDKRRALAVTLLVITASMAIAWPAQAVFFASHGMGRAGLLAPLVIEGPQWLAAILVGNATTNRARTWVFRLSTFVFASVAAGINYAHGAQTGGGMLGIIYGLASLTGVAAWEMYVHSARQAHSKRSPEQRRRAWQRRISFPRTYRRAVRLSRATGMDIEQAWPIAWREHHGADVGITADGLTRQNKAMAAVAKAYDAQSVVTLPGAQLTAAHLAQSARAWQLEAARRDADAADLDADDDVIGPFTPFTPAFTPQAAPFTPPVNTLPPTNPAESTDELAEARRMREAGWSYGRIGEHFGKSKTWAYNAINDPIPA